ncbi:MAG: hypothetical protein R2879_19510 [Saprospiraceae bacterium]
MEILKPTIALLFMMLIAICFSCEQNTGNLKQENQEFSIKAQYITTGALLNTPLYVTHEITYRDHKKIKEIRSSNSGKLALKFTEDFDENGRLISFKTEQNGELSVYQKNTYTDDDLLLSEFRIENNENVMDTALYEYHYPEDRPNPMNYYLTNNGEKVTEMTLSKSGNQEILEERAFGHDKYIGINTTTKIKNDAGQTIEERQVNIHSKWEDYSKVDTSIYDPTYFKYDEARREIRRENGTDITETQYHKNGIVKKIIKKSEGRPPLEIIFRRS